MAKILRFFMGIPGGDKREGLRQLETASTKGELTQMEARFNMAKSLRNYDFDYARAHRPPRPSRVSRKLHLPAARRDIDRSSVTRKRLRRNFAPSQPLVGSAACADRARTRDRGPRFARGKLK